MKQFLESMSTVIRTRLETAEGGAKDALEAAIRVAERMGAAEPAIPSHFVECLKDAAETTRRLGWAFRDLLALPWEFEEGDVLGNILGNVAAVEVVGYVGAQDSRLMDVEYERLLDASTEFAELAEIAESEIRWQDSARETISAVGAFRSGAAAVLETLLAADIVREAYDDPELEEISEGASRTEEAFHAILKAECLKRVPDLVEIVRSRLGSANDREIAFELNQEPGHVFNLALEAMKAAAEAFMATKTA